MSAQRDPKVVDQVALDELREGELNVKLLASGKKAVIVRRGAEVRCFGEVCPHMGADLAEADYDPARGTIACRWHGYVFSADDGRFLENPNEKLMGVLREPSKHFKPDKTPAYRLSRVPCRLAGRVVHLGRDTEDREP
jgi:nitrite reductase/ring-hydroxylating ferredoxin subunit